MIMNKNEGLFALICLILVFSSACMAGGNDLQISNIHVLSGAEYRLQSGNSSAADDDIFLTFDVSKKGQIQISVPSMCMRSFSIKTIIGWEEPGITWESP